jgi:Utp8 family
MPSGLESDGQWMSFELGLASPGSPSLSPTSSPLRLSGFSFIQNTSEATALRPNARVVSISSLGSSLVLLCGRAVQSQDLILLLWDLRYSVVLASHRLSIPADLSTSKDVSLDLVPALNTLILLTVSSGLLDKSTKTCSAVFVVPVTTPTTSTIANVMGRASSSARWLAKPNALPNGHTPNASFDSDRRGILDKLRSAIRQNRPEAADSAFSEWVEKRSSSVATLDPQVVRPGSEYVSIIFNMSQQDGPLFGHEFVREILDIILQPSKPASTLYPNKTIYYLLKNRVVSSGMLSQSLLELFTERKDWVSQGCTWLWCSILNRVHSARDRLGIKKCSRSTRSRLGQAPPLGSEGQPTLRCT